MLKQLMLAVAILATTHLMPVSAGEVEKREKVAEFVDLWKVPEMVRQYRTSCLEPFKATTPESTFRQDPAYFQGMTPASPLWTKVVAAYWRYAEASCSSLMERTVVEKHIDAWTERISENDLDTVLRFLRTKAGRAYVDGQHGVTDELLRYYAVAAKATTKVAYEAYLKDLTEIAREFDTQTTDRRDGR